MSFDRDASIEGDKGVIVKPFTEENDKQVPLYVRGWCHKHCDNYGGCWWLTENCPYYNTPQWMRKGEVNK